MSEICEKPESQNFCQTIKHFHTGGVLSIKYLSYMLQSLENDIQEASFVVLSRVSNMLTYSKFKNSGTSL